MTRLVSRAGLSTALVALSLAGAVAAAGPSAVAVDPVHDAGTVGRGEQISHTFTIRNDGDAPLMIREVQPTCGCTVAEYDEEIAAGRTGKVTAVVDTSSFSGPIAKAVNVLTNDPANPSLRVTIHALVEPHVDVSPGYARFDHVAGAAPKSSVQTVWSTTGPPLEILGVESPLETVSVSYRRSTDEERDPSGPDAQWRVEITLASAALEGPVVGNVLLTTNHPQRPEVEIPVSGYVKPVISIQPRSIDFGRGQVGQPRRASFIVTNNGADAVQVTSVETDRPGLAAEVEERSQGRRFYVVVTMAAPDEPGPFAGLLEVHTDDPAHEVLEVEYRGTTQ